MTVNTDIIVRAYCPDGSVEIISDQADPAGKIWTVDCYHRNKDLRRDYPNTYSKLVVAARNKLNALTA